MWRFSIAPRRKTMPVSKADSNQLRTERKSGWITVQDRGYGRQILWVRSAEGSDVCEHAHCSVI